ncbi:hypothetical protein FACS1894176_06630 [Bacteroidia bacterium]|nr:hypothetical protein FACS189428_2200 [Clostridia bacterium]GHV26254.1 hypothetical protein FACS1894176_06630 [Bacteroidia bacterium]
MKIIARIINEKLSLTNSTFPKKYPTQTKRDVQANPPITLYEKNFPYFIFPTPATNGANVRTMGTNLA